MAATSPLKNFELYELSKKLVLACYSLTAELPADEKTLLTHYLREAALKAHLQTAQGAFLRKKKRRRRFLGEAKNALLVIDAAVDVLLELALATAEATADVQQLSSDFYQLLDRLEKAK